MVNFALIGCGVVAKKHAEILSQKQVTGGRLISVCDRQQERADRFGRLYNVASYTDMFEMIKKVPEIDVINVLTPSGSHAEHVLALSEFGKHIVVEKPMALSLESADEMIQACRRGGIRLFVIKQNRYNLPVLRLRKAIEQNRFGKLVMGTVRLRWCRRQEYFDQDKWRGTLSLDGGIFFNQASHHIDLLEWMLGEPESVFAKSTKSLVAIETEDTGVAVIKFQNGALGIIEATIATRPTDIEGSLSILGEKGTVEIGGFAANQLKLWQFENPTPDDKVTIEYYSQNPSNEFAYAHAAYLQNVVNHFQNHSAQVVNGFEGRKSLRLITAIYESIETGREVLVTSALN